MNTIICDRCKKVLQDEDFYYTVKLDSFRPVKIPPGTLYGISSLQEPWQLCEDCWYWMKAELKGKGVQRRMVDALDIVSKVLTAIETIRKGVCKRIDVTDDIKVYECKNIIRIDINNKQED